MPVTVNKVLTTVFGSRNERLIKRYKRMVEQINAREPAVQLLSDDQLRARTQELRGLVSGGKLTSTEILPEAFAIIRESMDRHIGIRHVFNPDEHFDPDRLDDTMLAEYDSVQRKMIETGTSWLHVPIPTSIYAAVRKLHPESRPPFRARCFDVQLIGGLVLYEGRIAEMATGEGKTFVGPLACFMRVLEGFHCHVVTVNDYLVRRDASWVMPAFENLGLTVGYLQSDMEPGGETRRRQYACDVTYGTNSEFGFDYLRDNMKARREEQVQGPLDFAIVDEVDSVLIDEARTPLIISGAAHDDAAKYKAADTVARVVIEKNKPWDAVEKAVDAAQRTLKASQGDLDKARGKDEKETIRKRIAAAETQLAEAEQKKEGVVQYYEVELDRKSVHLTHEGIAAAQEAAGVGSFYLGNNMEWPHLMEQALRAHVVYEKDKDYVVERGPKGEMEVIIVDEFTGRKMAGRQWSDGLHQAAEAKERVAIKQETQTLATITLQNFFKLYRALSGMTGTAQTEAEEFNKIYRLDVVSIPTNRQVIRQDNEDRVYRTEQEKWSAILDEIKDASETGRPVLVGTTSVEKSEMLSMMLKRKYGIDHEVLNAKNHEREAQIVALAGQQHKNQHGELVGNVTVATNMAGRGTDIKPAPETFFDVVESPKATASKWTIKQRGTGKTIEIDAAPDADGAQSPLVNLLQLSPGAKTVGGLHVIATERHTARRIDNQLRGRSGRQGDPGSSRFYVSLQDDLMKMFAGEWTIKVLGWLGMEEGMAIEDKRISKGILRAQKKVEERNYLARKNLLEYDEVMDHQRTHFYGMRQQVLEGRDVAGVIWGMIGDAITDAVDKFITQDYIAATVAEWARMNFQVNLDASDLRGKRDIDDLEHYIKDQSRAEAETTIPSGMGEFSGEDESVTATWDAKGLASWAMSRFHVQLSQAQIRKSTPQQIEQTLRDAAIAQINARSVDELQKYLAPLYPENELANWARTKFGIELTGDEISRTARTARNSSAAAVAELIDKRARAAYARRDVEYPVEHVLSFVFGGPDGSTDNPYAADFLRNWVASKYGIDLPIDTIRSKTVRQLHEELCGYQEAFTHGGRLEKDIDAIMAAGPTAKEQLAAFNARFRSDFTEETLKPETQSAAVRAIAGASRNGAANASAAAATDTRTLFMKLARSHLRRELTDLEQFVLIQIFDQSWKDHLYAMDMLKSGIGLQAFAEQDPRVLYKKEGYEYFQQMMAGIRDKVTDLIFRAKVQGEVQARSAYRETAAVHEDAGGYGVSENIAATASAVEGEQPPRDGGEAGEPGGIKTIVRDQPKVGRNDLCPCGSGKKYKKCCGADAA
jgi:preprotein translocase subunit SecA